MDEYEQGIKFTMPKPTQPYWEQLGYKSAAELYSKQHVLYKTVTGYYCFTCGDVEIIKCKLSKNE